MLRSVAACDRWRWAADLPKFERSVLSCVVPKSCMPISAKMKQKTSSILPTKPQNFKTADPAVEWQKQPTRIRQHMAIHSRNLNRHFCPDTTLRNLRLL